MTATSADQNTTWNTLTTDATTTSNCITRRFRLKTHLGLGFRNARRLSRIASHQDCAIRLRAENGSVADCRSMFAVAFLAANRGTVVELQATGPDANNAVTAFDTVIRKHFGEWLP